MRNIEAKTILSAKNEQLHLTERKGEHAMDKHLIGKWYKEELGETLNIFGEDPPRMKMSFSSSGYYNFEPNCVYEDGEELCFEINDEHYRTHMSMWTVFTSSATGAESLKMSAFWSPSA